MKGPTQGTTDQTDFVECDRRCPVCYASVYERRANGGLIIRCAHNKHNCPYHVDTRE